MLEVKPFMIDRAREILMTVLGRIDSLVAFLIMTLLIDSHHSCIQIRFRISPFQLIVDDYFDFFLPCSLVL